MYFTYIIHAASIDRYYVGISENPTERLKKHNAKNKGFTNQAADWKIVYLRKFESKREALDFEKMAEESEVNQNDYLFYLLELISGRKPGSEIWQPVQ